VVVETLGRQVVGQLAANRKEACEGMVGFVFVFDRYHGQETSKGRSPRGHLALVSD
jgi:hypothetical protein